jgi:hypothetical protein
MERLEYTLTEQDLLEFNLYHASQSRRRKLSQLRYRWLIPVIYLGFGIFLATRSEYQAAGMFAAVAVIWALVAPLWLNLRFRRYFQRYVQEHFAEIINQPMTMQLTQEGIQTNSPLGQSLHPYAAVDRIVDHHPYTYIYIGKAMALVLPHDRIPEVPRQRFVKEVERRRPSTLQANSRMS